MADVIRACSFQSLRFSSSSVLTSFSSTSGCLQLGLPPNQISDNKRIYPLAAASSSAGLARFSLTPRKRLISFKVYSFTFFRTHLLELFIFAVFPDNWDVSCLCFCSNLDYWCQKSFFFSLLWDWEILGELFYSVQFIVSLIFIFFIKKGVVACFLSWNVGDSYKVTLIHYGAPVIASFVCERWYLSFLGLVSGAARNLFFNVMIIVWELQNSHTV